MLIGSWSTAHSAVGWQLSWWCRRLLCGVVVGAAVCVVVWCRRLVSLSLVSSFLLALASFGVTVVGVTVGGVAVVVLLALVSLFCSRRCRRLVSSFGVIVGVVVGVAVVGFVVSVVVGVVGVVGDTACWRCRRFCRF